MIRVDDFVKALSLTTLCASSKNEWPIESADLNRPGLQFAGHYEYFAMERPQVIGKAEMGYLESLEPEVRVARLRKFFSYPIPCVILCRGMRPPHFRRARTSCRGRLGYPLSRSCSGRARR